MPKVLEFWSVLKGFLLLLTDRILLYEVSCWRLGTTKVAGFVQRDAEAENDRGKNVNSSAAGQNFQMV